MARRLFIADKIRLVERIKISRNITHLNSKGILIHSHTFVSATLRYNPYGEKGIQGTAKAVHGTRLVSCGIDH